MVKLQIFVYFHPYLGGMIPILTSIFFKGVGSTTNQYFSPILFCKNESDLVTQVLKKTYLEPETAIHLEDGNRHQLDEDEPRLYMGNALF